MDVDNNWFSQVVFRRNPQKRASAPHALPVVFPDSSSLSSLTNRITPPSSNRTMSDPSKLSLVQPNAAPVKRASSLMTIRGFAFRRSSIDSYSRSPFPSWNRSRRGAASEDEHAASHSPSCDATRHTSPLTSPRRAKFTIEPIDTLCPPSSFYYDCLPNDRQRHEGSPKRKCTLAMAITDEAITDEVLVQEFERLRTGRELNDTEGLCLDLDDPWDVWEADRGPTELPLSNQDPSSPLNIPYTPSLPSFPTHKHSNTATRSPTTPSASWHAARRALLTCRELVRTERHYLSSLQSLLASETVTAPPALMLRYVEGLACVSQSFIQCMEEDPSACGVAAAFLAVEYGLECAFVGWCGVVGGWFEGQDGTTKRRGNNPQGYVDGRSSLKRSGSSPWRISVPSLPPMASPVSPAAFLSRRREKDKAREQEKLPLSSTREQEKLPLSSTSANGARKRRHSVRDLAILPTQRIMRYVLLYRDLLGYTPSTSPSRALVQRAVEAACRIAQKCDRAQGNATFLQHQ